MYIYVYIKHVRTPRTCSNSWNVFEQPECDRTYSGSSNVLGTKGLRLSKEAAYSLPKLFPEMFPELFLEGIPRGPGVIQQANPNVKC